MLPQVPAPTSLLATVRALTTSHAARTVLCANTTGQPTWAPSGSGWSENSPGVAAEQGSPREETGMRDCCYGNAVVPGAPVTSDLPAKTGREGEGQGPPEASARCCYPLRCSALLVRGAHLPTHTWSGHGGHCHAARPGAAAHENTPCITHLPQATGSRCQRRRPGARPSAPNRRGALQDNKGAVTEARARSAPSPAALLSLRGPSTPGAAARQGGPHGPLPAHLQDPVLEPPPPPGPCAG